MFPKLKLGLLLLLGSYTAAAQENSPFSRYGIGDLNPAKNVVNRGIGGVSTPVITSQSVNFSNPATYSGHKIVTYDVGVFVDNRTLKSADPVRKYSSTNFLPSYVAVGLPLSSKRNLGLAFGLKPISSINYSVQERGRLTGIDSIATLYEGSGGLYQLFAGVGKSWRGLRIGFNTGYSFGRKETNTRRLFVNDTLEYTPSNSATITTFGKVFFDAGLQYEFKVSKSSLVRLGVNANLKQTYNAKQDEIRETFVYDVNSASQRIDSIYESVDRKGTIDLPATYSAGIMWQSFSQDKLGNRMERSSIGVEYETAKWSEFRFYGVPDQLNDVWMLRVGGQLTPNPLSVTSYWNRVNYRAGFYTGRDYVNAQGEMPVAAITLGAGLPVRKWRSFDNQYTIINTAFEVGRRGNKDNKITENFFRFSLGLSLSDIWFIKRRYD